MSVYMEVLQELLLDGAVSLPPRTSKSTYYRYAREINEICARERIERKCKALPKEKLLKIV